MPLSVACQKLLYWWSSTNDTRKILKTIITSRHFIGLNIWQTSYTTSDIIAVFICPQEGYYLSGPNVKSCQKNKSWSGGEVACDRITCPFLRAPLHSVMSCSNNNEYGSECTFSCDVSGLISANRDATQPQSLNAWERTFNHAVSRQCLVTSQKTTPFLGEKALL